MKTLQHLLLEFYDREGIPNGGIDSKYFSIRFLGVKISLPNVAYRKRVIHIHDLQHVLNQCDTSWKGEGYIAGWELATGIWRYPVLGMVSLWTFGYCVWQYPRSVYDGYKKGLTMTGIVDLKMTRQDLLAWDLQTLQRKTTKANPKNIRLLQKVQFGLWILLAVCVFLLPIVVLAVGIIGIKNLFY